MVITVEEVLAMIPSRITPLMHTTKIRVMYQMKIISSHIQAPLAAVNR